jgi:hypothetical protein
MSNIQSQQWLPKCRECLSIFLFVLLTACTGSGQYAADTLTLVHINDTHSHLEQMAVNLTTAELGWFVAIKMADGFRADTGLMDSDAFRDYLQSLGSVSNPTEQRIVILD